MKHLSAIKGINELLQALPEEYHHFYRFGTILKLEIEKSFDLETWSAFLLPLRTVIGICNL